MENKTEPNLVPSSSSALAVKQNLVKVKRSIKKKFHDLHNEKLLINERINEEYKPLIEPLKKIATSADNSIAIKKEKDNSTYDGEIDSKKIKKFKPKRLSFTRYNSSATAKKKSKIRKSHTPYSGDYGTLHKIGSASDDGDDDELFESIPGSSKQFLSSTIRPTSVSGSDSKTKNILITSDDDDDDGDADDESQLRGAETKSRKKIQLTPQNDKKYYTANTSGERGGVYLGKEEVTFNTEFILVKRKRYKRTEGLLNLICSDNPRGYTANDLKEYKTILELTNAHRQNFTRNSQIVRDNSRKYNKIIKALFPIEGRGESKRLNKLQTKYMIVNKSGQIDYIYWDDPNELVERLRLLTSSKSVGHTAHNNEIMSIIEELHEANLIE